MSPKTNFSEIVRIFEDKPAEEVAQMLKANKDIDALNFAYQRFEEFSSGISERMAKQWLEKVCKECRKLEVAQHLQTTDDWIECMSWWFIQLDATARSEIVSDPFTSPLDEWEKR